MPETNLKTLGQDHLRVAQSQLTQYEDGQILFGNNRRKHLTVIEENLNYAKVHHDIDITEDYQRLEDLRENLRNNFL